MKDRKTYVLKNEFLNKIRLRYPDNFNKYDYSLLPNEFHNKDKIKIICKEHGVFEQRVVYHTSDGNGCPRCGGNIKNTTQDFVKKAKLIHGDKYDYSKVNYINAHTKVIINCPIHGDFTQTPSNHLLGNNCLICSHNVNRFSIDKFISKANKIHNYKYNYDKVKYITSKDKVIITCPIHGDFEQKPTNHINKPYCGCFKCFSDKLSYSKDEFISKANLKHNYKYDYSLINYIAYKDKIKIICPKHGLFEQRPDKHLISKTGCHKCSIENTANLQRSNKLDFINKANIVHKHKYNYDSFKYINNKTSSVITCPIHGDFEQTPNTHIRGSGCPKCRESSGEKYISRILEKYNIKYISQYRINGYKYRYDFYLSDYNIYIEYNGEQHYIPVGFYGGIKGFKKIIKRDKIKKELVKRSTGLLIIIKHNYKILDQIESELIRLFTIIHPDFLINKDLVKEHINQSNIYLINNGICYKRKNSIQERIRR